MQTEKELLNSVYLKIQKLEYLENKIHDIYKHTKHIYDYIIFIENLYGKIKNSLYDFKNKLSFKYFF